MTTKNYFLSLIAVLSLSSIAASTEAAITSELKYGDHGKNITALQSFLATKSSWYPDGFVTGYYGPLTQAGVQRFQQYQNIAMQGTPETTGFGRVGPITLARLNALMGGTPGDVNAPFVQRMPSEIKRTTANIAWSTSERAVSRVMYAKSWPFVYSGVASVSSAGYGTDVRIELTNLQPNTTYHYVRESVDPSGNVMWVAHESFTTKK